MKAHARLLLHRHQHIQSSSILFSDLMLNTEENVKGLTSFMSKVMNIVLMQAFDDGDRFFSPKNRLGS